MKQASNNHGARARLRLAGLAGALTLLSLVPTVAAAELNLTLERLSASTARLTGTGTLPDIDDAGRPADVRLLRLLGASSDQPGGAGFTPGFALGGKALTEVSLDPFVPSVDLLFAADLVEPDDGPSGSSDLNISNNEWASIGTSGNIIWGKGLDAMVVGSFTVVSASNQAPTADPGGPYNGKAGQPVTFDGSRSSDSDGFVTRYAWNFGDGSQGQGIRPEHVYERAGTYPVSLRVTDNSGTDSPTAFTNVTALGGPPRPDILLRNSANGRWYLYEIDGRDTSAEAKPDMQTDPDFQPVSRADFDGDGDRDLLIRDIVGSKDGQFTLYTFDGVEITDSGDPGLPKDLSYAVISTDDFDGDGRGDVLLRKDSGEWFMALMDGLNVLDSGNPNLPKDPTMTPTTTGDFDGDGKSDVLLAREDGTWVMALMDGLAVKDKGGPPLKKNFKFGIEAVADFDGDGNEDILMRSFETGGWRLMQMDGYVVTNESWVGLKTKSVFALQTTGDFNGDRRADILLRHSGTGKWISYLMDGPVILESGNPGLPSKSKWHFIETDDTDSNDSTDIILRSDDGIWKVWLYADEVAARESGRLEMKEPEVWQAVPN